MGTKKGLDFTGYSTDPAFEDEFFGGFRPSEDGDPEIRGFSTSWHARFDGKPVKPGPGEVRGRQARPDQPAGWRGIWNGSTGLIGHNGGPPITGWLVRAARGPQGWAGVPPDGLPPFVWQALLDEERQVRPDPTPERDRAEELRRLEWRLAQLDKPTDPNAGPSASYALGVLREERLQLLAQHTERRIQKLYRRRYRPSKALELKRFPKLPSVATKLLPKEAMQPPVQERRAQLEMLVAKYLAKGGKITICPPEKTAAQCKAVGPLIALRERRKPGRKPIGLIAMSNAERVARHRRRRALEQLLKTLAPNERNKAGAEQPPVPGLPVPAQISK